MIFIIAISAINYKMLNLELSKRKAKEYEERYGLWSNKTKSTGCSDYVIKEIMKLSESGMITEALQKMKKERCRLMDELHKSGRKVDCLDFLIRQTEKEIQANH